MRDTLLTLWNTWSFFTTYAVAQRVRPGRPGRPGAGRPLGARPLDAVAARTPPWRVVTESLDGYEPFPAATAIAELIDDTSNWYVRRSRRRFWRTDPDADPADSLGAQATLHEVLVTVARLLAPMRPFLADRMWRDLTGAADDDSVHLADWPEADPALVDPSLEAGMALARRLSSLGRAARAEAGVKVRQPLARALVYLPPGSPDAAAGGGGGRAQRGPGRGHRRAGRRPGLRAGAQLQAARAPARQAGPGPAVGHGAPSTRRPPPPSWPPAGRCRSSSPTDPSSWCGEEVELRVRAQPGFAVSRDGAEVLALDLALDDDLRRRGLAREVIRHVQDLRKETGLEVSDRSILHLVGLDDLDPLFDAIAREVLAVRIATSAARRTPGRARPSQLDDGRLGAPVHDLGR